MIDEQRESNKAAHKSHSVHFDERLKRAKNAAITDGRTDPSGVLVHLAVLRF